MIKKYWKEKKNVENPDKMFRLHCRTCGKDSTNDRMECNLCRSTNIELRKGYGAYSSKHINRITQPTIRVEK